MITYILIGILLLLVLIIFLWDVIDPDNTPKSKYKYDKMTGKVVKKDEDEDY